MAEASRKFGLYTPSIKAYVGREGEKIQKGKSKKPITFT
jgi:hypothetical protein